MFLVSPAPHRNSFVNGGSPLRGSRVFQSRTFRGLTPTAKTNSAAARLDDPTPAPRGL